MSGDDDLPAYSEQFLPQAIHELNREVVVGTRGELDDGRGRIQILSGLIVVVRIDQHGLGADEVGTVQSAAILKHIGTLARWRVGLGVVRTQQARGVQVRGQDRRYRNAHRTLDAGKHGTILERVNRAVDNG